MIRSARTASAGEMTRTLTELAGNIGTRLAGSEAERRAAEWIADRFAMMQLETSIEDFPVLERAVDEEALSVKLAGRWHDFPCSLFGLSPGTGGETLEAEVEFLTPPVDLQDGEDLSRFRGKAVICFGCHIATLDMYRRLMAAEPRFIMMADIRHPGDLPLADGLFPNYVFRCGAAPTVNVAYRDLWQWALGRASRARLRVSGGMRPSLSRNVIGTLRGSDPAAGTLYVGAHHDTQAGTPGADDDASGVAACVELARILAPTRLRRTIKFITFGAEEQLSVGAAVYARRHRREIARLGKVMLNFDSCGGVVGWNQLSCNGGRDMERCWRAAAAARKWRYRSDDTVSPFGDQFPFLAAGVPAIWVSRQNCSNGWYAHHRRDDDLAQISPETMADVVQTAADFLKNVADSPRMPFRTKLPPELESETAALWREYFGGWRGFRAPSDRKTS